MIYDECDRCGYEDTLSVHETGYGDYECLCNNCADERNNEEDQLKSLNRAEGEEICNM